MFKWFDCIRAQPCRAMHLNTEEVHGIQTERTHTEAIDGAYGGGAYGAGACGGGAWDGIEAAHLGQAAVRARRVRSCIGFPACRNHGHGTRSSAASCTMHPWGTLSLSALRAHEGLNI